MKLLDFWAPWCGPCRMMAPTIEALEKEFTIDKINVDEAQDLVSKYQVMSVPTYIILDTEGKEIQRFTGFTPSEKLRNALVAQ